MYSTKKKVVSTLPLCSQPGKRITFFCSGRNGFFGGAPPDSTCSKGQGALFLIYLVSVIPWADSIKRDGQGSPGGLSERCCSRATAVAADQRDTRRASVLFARRKTRAPHVHPPSPPNDPMSAATRCCKAKQRSSLCVSVCIAPANCGYRDSNLSTWALSNKKKSNACSWPPSLLKLTFENETKNVSGISWNKIQHPPDRSTNVDAAMLVFPAPFSTTDGGGTLSRG